ncbi:Down syndrome cell adhesion molecule-like protein [Leptotrombidium deliense]|uniref:Down syndrome cell adhesion molecule-like protein n=1 Tax=Leptotrombidium deliense TaxID=299467 RepID=A0A443SUS2_9ACAR|nr:Down syndrome cell adhesion molecule-like protein [Leptotrombidium deliense]
MRIEVIAECKTPKPKWIHEPANNASGVLGEKMMIHCSADGYPPPILIWQKALFSSESEPRNEFVSIKSNGIHIMSNGSLLFEALKDEDEAFYLCSASNGIGDGISKLVFLKVNKPPRLNSQLRIVSAKVNDSGSLECRAKGDFPIVFIWLKDGHKLSLTLFNKKFSVNEETNNEKSEAVSLLTISPVRRADAGLYSCEARNQFGEAISPIKLTVLEPPSKPRNVSVSNTSSRSFTLQWKVDFDGNAAIRRYRLQYQEIRNGIRAQLKEHSVDGETDSLFLGNLRPVTLYTMRLSAENNIGSSEFSDAINATTNEEAPEGPPLDVKVQSTGSQSLKVSWSPPETELQHGTMLGYYIGYKTADGEDQYQYKHFVPSHLEVDETFHTIYLTNLKPLTKYSIVMQAYNKAGAGPLCDAIQATTLETSPPISPILRVVETTKTSIKLEWNRDEKDKSILTQFTLYWKEENKKDWNQLKLAANVHEYTLSALLCGTRYQLYMTATNSLGTGEPSATVSHRTRGAAPVSPLFKNAFLTTNTSEITLNLDAWNNGGCPIHYFNVQKKLKHAKQWTIVHEKIENRKQYTISSYHLIPGRDYVLLVIAKNDAGITQADYEVLVPKTHHSPITTKMPAIAVNNNLISFDNFPLYKNLAFILPIVVSLTVIMFLVAIIFLCLRKTPEPVYNTYSEEAKPTNSVSMSELSSQKSASRLNINTKSEVSTSNLRSNSVHSQLSNCTNQDVHCSPQKHFTVHEYSEPYTTDARNVCHPLSKDHFATIKRTNPRTRTSMYISGYEVSQMNSIDSSSLYTNKMP